MPKGKCARLIGNCKYQQYRIIYKYFLNCFQINICIFAIRYSNILYIVSYKLLNNH